MVATDSVRVLGQLVAEIAFELYHAVFGYLVIWLSLAVQELPFAVFRERGRYTPENILQ